MPTVPVSQNRVGVAELTNAKLQAADTSGTGLQALGVGLQQLGKSGAEYAEAQADLHALMDETAAKGLDVTGAQGLNGILRDDEDAYYRKQGLAAVDARADADKKMQKLRADLSLQAQNDRQKRLFLGAFDRRIEAERADMSRYALGQAMSAARDQSIARQQTYAQDARTFAGNDERRELSVDTGLAEIETQGHHEFWSEARTATEKSKFLTDVYGGIVADKMIDDVAGALDFLNSHADKIAPEREGQLRQALAGPLRERQGFEDAQSLVGGLPSPSTGAVVVADSAPASSTTTVARKIIGAESGGSTTAKNAVSSASGLGQFTRKTFVDLYTQTYGAGDKTPDQIWAQRFDPGLGKQMTELLVVQNAAMLQKAGVPATDGTIYLAHFLGPRATSVLKANPSTPIAQLVPAEFIRKNPTVLGGGKTAGDVVAWADRRMGGHGTRPTFVPQREDMEGLYRQIDAHQDWTFERKQAARSALEQIISRQDALVERRERDAERAALDRVTELGENFKSMGQLGALATQLSPHARQTLTEQARQNAVPKPIEAHGDTIMTLNQAAELTPEKFKETDLRLYSGKMTRAEYDQISRLQAQMIAKPNSPAQISHSQIWRVINLYGSDIGLKTGARGEDESKAKYERRRAEAMRLFTIINNYVHALTEDKRSPTDDEVKRAFDNAIMPVAKTNPGWFGSAIGSSTEFIPRFRDTTKPTNSVAIPESVQRSLRARLRAAGLPYDDQSVARLYMQRPR
jgi:hypothetical protein